MEFSRDESILFTGGKDGAIRCWRVEDSKLELSMEGHQG